MEVSAFIPDDGYTETAFLKAVDKIHPSVTFDFRPMLIEEQAQTRKEWERLAKAEDLVGQRKLYAGKLAKHIVGWDLVNPRGGLVAITPENILRLKDVLFFKMFNVVTLNQMGDDAPEGAKPTDLLESQKN